MTIKDISAQTGYIKLKVEKLPLTVETGKENITVNDCLHSPGKQG